MNTIHHLLFNSPLKGSQIPAFRGALIKEMGMLAHPLMHNHTENGLRFSYPLVQYKIIDGKASIVAFDEVGLHIREYFHQMNSVSLKIGKTKHICQLVRAEQFDYTFETNEAPNYYSIVDYLPLTGENVVEYDSLMALTDKISFIENILTGNIISLLKGIDKHAEEKIICVISSIERQHTIKYKGVNFRAFDMHFVSNVVLPNYIGLGKSTSIGMGTIIKEQLPEKFNSYIK